MMLIQKSFDTCEVRWSGYETQITQMGLRKMILIRTPGVATGQIFHQEVLALKTCMLNSNHPGKATIIII